LTDALRKAIKQSGKTRYELSKLTGVGQDILSKFMRGGGIKLETADRLAAYFKLVLKKDR
jgi:transcriptional regulator with XRE-family HTH domain